MIDKVPYILLTIFFLCFTILFEAPGQKLGDKYILFKPSNSNPEARFSYVKSLKKGYNTKTSKLSWDTYTEVNVVHLQDILNLEFEVIKINKNGSVIIALNKPTIVDGKEVIHEPRYILKNFKDAVRSKEIISKKEFETFVSNKFPSDKDRLLNKESWVGMTEEQVYISNGKPSKVSSLKTKQGIKKQYEYPLLKKKIILEQGKVTAIKSFYY